LYFLLIFLFTAVYMSPLTGLFSVFLVLPDFFNSTFPSRNNAGQDILRLQKSNKQEGYI